MKDNFGNRMKSYEYHTTSTKLIKGIPIIARLDGRSFSSFTKGLKKPYDERLSNLMLNTAKFLVMETNCDLSYNQSDEITLLWNNNDYNSEIFFNGKLFKLTSILSSLASGFFNKNLPLFIPEKKESIPIFDARVYNVPNQIEAVNTLLWRELDATRNSITMAAQYYYSHKELLNKSSSEKKEMLLKKGIDWNKYPSSFKRGSYVMNKKVSKPFSKEELDSLPQMHNARKNPNLVIERNVLEVVEMPIFSKISNKVGVIFNTEEPILFKDI
jgi:tRNA(His) guanylyltransferase